jgi:predicted nuclease of predicted toxin-antitoxin system
MKLLLDENLPKRLKVDLMEFEVSTVSDNGWAGKKNGELMNLMLVNNFDILLTFDKNLQFQQNFNKYSLTVFVLSAKDNTYKTLVTLIPIVKEKIKLGIKPGPEIIKT